MSEQTGAQQPADDGASVPRRHGDAELLFREVGTVRRALGQSVGGWEPITLRGRWLINSHPKSGTHLMRNVLLHFNRHELYRDFLFSNTFEAGLKAREGPQIYIGHVAYEGFASAVSPADVHPVLLVRHPYAVLLALARAFYDVNTERADYRRMRAEYSFEEIVAHVASGYECAGFRHSSLAESLTHLTTNWLGKVPFTLKFEAIAGRLEGPDHLLVAYFAPLLEVMFGTVPDDAAGRIRAGASPAISATFSRTRDAASTRVRLEDAAAVIAPGEARRLREIAAMLGYSSAAG